MRRLAALLALLLGAVGLLPAPPAAHARPEFARREAKACGYCHINPRGGGPRNDNGLLYARSEFSFPVVAGNLGSFRKDADRERMVYARKMIDLDHIPAAIDGLARLSKVVKDEGAKKLVEEEIHGIEVRGSKILGQARLLLRGKPQEIDEGVELVVLLVTEYKGLAIHEEALGDLRELRADKDLRDRVRKEEAEAKARLLLLDATRQDSDGSRDKAKATLDKLIKASPGTRAAEEAKKLLEEWAKPAPAGG